MPIEAGTVISELDASWPLSGDPIVEGDNHLRLIKSVLQTQFPGAGGGFNIPIIATEDEINHLEGVTGNIQDQLDEALEDTLIAPAGTVMLFHQATPPVSWTNIAAHNDKMLRVVSGLGGGSGGVDAPFNFDFSHAHTTGDHTLIEAEMPSHIHTLAQGDLITTSGDTEGTSGRYSSAGTDVGDRIAATGGDAAHNHGSTSNELAVFQPLFVDIILASKD